MEYCIRHQPHDILVTGISNSENPLRESKTCVVL
ncbi:guanine nucleotide-binding protein G(I)/G(S)/G(O) subunit gamma-12-like protein [Leptotrombidium deliense]|uniref:Guanine nucleotide-binding protein G(I)/G(S)/G(O) subunit gamma-12-like protein n=1 Tax=Leptotrombidium deliense TaxID=299467 RepID=A0A443SKZ5_9ACAR|nr:guanine nucleotide-binding protein G(I)/G(S)/G(O) subunit gamma-12-like protein [Leptotrombidium deliense]